MPPAKLAIGYVSSLLFAPFLSLSAQEEARLVRDISRWSLPTSRSGSGGALVGDQWFFAGSSAASGVELWVTNGKPGGTRMVEDIRPGSMGSIAAGGMLAMGGHVYFTASDGAHGTELWRSDGTPEGTGMVVDMNDPSWGQISLVAASDSHVWYKGKLPSNPFEGNPSLWVSDGTPEGSIELNPLVPTPPHGFGMRAFEATGPSALLGDSLVFATTSTAIWKSDGTAVGTLQLVDLSNDWNDKITTLVTAGDSWFAVLDDGSGGQTLWRGNGQAGPVTLITRADNTSRWRFLGDVHVFKDSIIFLGADQSGRSSMWICDGSSPTPQVFLPSYPYPSDIHVAGQTMFFTYDSGGEGKELWKTDGTDAGTMTVKIIRPGPVDAGIADMTVVGDRLFFIANDEVHGREIWVSDGTEKGTRMLADMHPEEMGDPAGQLVAGGPLLYFNRYRGSHAEYWVSDGTVWGTRRLLGGVQGNGSSIYSYPGASTAVAVGNNLFFKASDRRGEELWISNGKAGGTRMVHDLVPKGSSSPYFIAPLRNGVVFLAYNKDYEARLWFSDGTRAGTQLLSDFGGDLRSFVKLGELYYYTVNEILWRTDGTKEGTFQVPHKENGFEVETNTDRGFMAAAGGRLYFTGNHTFLRTDLWCLEDGSFRKIKSIQPNAVDWPKASFMTPVGDRLAFFATAYPDDRDLWTSDGTEVGTRRIKADFRSVSHSMTLGAQHLFIAHDGSHGMEWWKSDGTSSGTSMVKDIMLGSDAGVVTDVIPAVAADAIYFVANDGIHGEELWRTDGTPGGTKMVIDLIPGYAGSEPSEIAVVRDRIFFSADDSVHGPYLWSTDGTEADTVMISMKGKERTDPRPHMLTPAKGGLFFSATHDTKGNELHVLDLAPEK